jgi:hypothetical protein
MCADVMIDGYVWFFIDDIVKQQHDKISNKKKDVLTLSRLNMMERLLFIVGASLQPLVIFNFSGLLVPNFAAASSAFYTGTFLMSIAVLSFLQRSTKIWTAGRTNTCLVIMGLGCIFKNFRYIIVNHNLMMILYECGNYLLNISFGFQILFTFMCFVTYCAEKYNNINYGKLRLRLLMGMISSHASTHAMNSTRILSLVSSVDRYTPPHSTIHSSLIPCLCLCLCHLITSISLVPAGHMVALMLSCCSDIYYLHGPTTGDYSEQYLWERVVATAMMIITVIVIVLER